MSELKPCPFCGSRPNISKASHIRRESGFGVEFTISCPTCHIHFRANSEFEVNNKGQVKTVKDGYKTIIDKWNTRYEEVLPPLFREDIDDYD